MKGKRTTTNRKEQTYCKTLKLSSERNAVLQPPEIFCGYCYYYATIVKICNFLYSDFVTETVLRKF